jgi:serine/threonine-protein kinase
MVDVGKLINGKYRLVRLIGDGGMGSVYEATHEVLGVNVALKFLHSELSEEFNLKERFLQEARVSATIQSPHIVRVMDVDVFEDQPYLVMDLLKGEPLQRRISSQGRLTIPQTLDYAQQILIGLQEAHEKNIVHRDLKPDNVFITRGPQGEELLKILDFGIAKLRQAAGAKGHLTQPGAVMGTPEYMAPEQAYSADQVDARSDVYSVGVMLFEMLSGKRPVEGETPQDIAHKILMGEVLRLEEVAPEVPAGLARVIHTAMEPRPEDRWADARALREALLPFIAVNPFATTGIGRPMTGQGTPFLAISKTPRIDGTRPAQKSDRPDTRVDVAKPVSLDIPVVVASERVPATVPPSAGPPRASALPPSPTPDPALAATVNQTADMPMMPDRRAVGAGATVNIPPVASVPVHRATVVRKTSGPNWAMYVALATLVLGGGGAFGYYYYDSVYDAPVPPPRPVRHMYTQASPGAAAAPAATQVSGPTAVQPLDPKALEVEPEDRWRNAPVSPAPAPRPAPQLGGGVTGSAGSAPTTPAGAPVFTLPTAIPLPSGSIPITLPTAFPPLSLPTGFSIPGWPAPAPAPAPNSN